MVPFLLSVMSKTVTATLPGALLVIFWWQRGRLSWKGDVLPLLPFFLLGAGGGLITAWWELQINQCVGPDFTLTFVERCLIAGRTVWFLLWKLIWPTKLTFIYPRWQIDSAAWRQYVFPLAAVGLLLVLWAIRRLRAPLAALLFFGGTLFPVLGFFNLYTFKYSFVANHYQYLASLGIITLAAAGAATLLDRRGLWQRPGGYAACALLLTVLAALTWQRSQTYADIETLYQTTIDENPDCWMAHIWLGYCLSLRGQTDEAQAHFEAAIKIKPDCEGAHYNLGLLLAGRGQVDEAIAEYRKALELQPDFADAHKNLAFVLTERGEFDEAIVHFQKVVEFSPASAMAHFNLGTALSRRERFDEADCRVPKGIGTQARLPRSASESQRRSIPAAEGRQASSRSCNVGQAGLGGARTFSLAQAFMRTVPIFVSAKMGLSLRRWEHAFDTKIGTGPIYACGKRVPHTTSPQPAINALRRWWPFRPAA